MCFLQMGLSAVEVWGQSHYLSENDLVDDEDDDGKDAFIAHAASLFSDVL